MAMYQIHNLLTYKCCKYDNQKGINMLGLISPDAKINKKSHPGAHADLGQWVSWRAQGIHWGLDVVALHSLTKALH